MKPTFTKRPRHLGGRVIGRGKRGGRRASVKKMLWGAQKKIARLSPEIGVQHLNAREFRWWFRDQVYMRMREAEFQRRFEFPWMALFCDRAREELLKAEDERVFAQLDAIASRGWE